MSTRYSAFDLRAFDIHTVDVAASPRRAVERPTIAKTALAAKAKPKVAVPQTTLQPAASVAEVESLRMELAVLRTELRAIKDAPAAEERRRNMQDLLAADFAWRRQMLRMKY